MYIHIFVYGTHTRVLRKATTSSATVTHDPGDNYASTTRTLSRPAKAMSAEGMGTGSENAASEHESE